MKSRRKKWLAGLALMAVLGVPGLFFMMQRKNIEVSSRVPEETSASLTNPDCGIYHLYGYNAGEDPSTVLKDIREDQDVSLELVEVNLKAYRDCDIDSSALSDLDGFLTEAGQTDKHLILRFLYDVDGAAGLTEPESIDVILRHMEQLGPVLVRHAEDIYVLQGFFLGNWGEFNGSRFYDMHSFRKLYAKLREVTEGKIRLAVRMPVQWRMIFDTNVTADNAESCGLGLYNDGMTGSGTDYGTYAAYTDGKYESLTDQDMKSYKISDFNLLSPWPRDPEMDFQNLLCRYQPNGGEVIHVNAWNDMEQALRSFRRMHVSYLNVDYDAEVWKKWSADMMQEKGAFQGMSGDTYIKRHLGYRYILYEAGISYNWWRNNLTVKMKYRNEGFAPIYTDTKAEISLISASGDTCMKSLAAARFRELYGGTDTGQTLSLNMGLTVKNLEKGSYTVVLRIQRADGLPVQLGNINDGTAQDPYYEIGTVDVQ
ncbi:MAG: DUF4832 domain-containing protein [Bilifractor sp.]